MKATLRRLGRDDIGPLIRMQVRKDQTGFVAPNVATIAQVAYEPNAEVFVIRYDGVTVGLVALIDLRGYPHLEEGDDPEAGFLWRLLIAPDHQGKGIGRETMGAVRDWAKETGLSRLYTSAVPENEVALRLYESLGFTRTGRIVDNEVELRWQF